MTTAAGIAASIGGVLGFPIFSFIIGFVSDNLGLIISNTKSGDSNHGIRIDYTEIIRYYQNPATGHREYYDSHEQLNSISTY